MIITCDLTRMTDKVCNDKGWNHAYVMGLDNCGSNMIWGPDVERTFLPIQCVITVQRII